jgi:hypothetical protein
MAMTCDRVRELAPGFVLGALEIEEMIAVQDHLDGCAEPHPEMDELGGVVPYIAQTLAPVEPPAWLRESVIAAAKADSLARRRVGKGTEHRIREHGPAAVGVTIATEELATAATVERELAPVISLRARIWSRRARIATWATRAAAALLVVSLGSYAYVVQNDLNQANHKVPSIVQMMGPDTRQAPLTPTNASSKSGGLAVLQQTGHLYVAVNHLDATAGDQVYMVWVTAEKGDVSKVGWFTVDSSGWAQLEFDRVPTSPSLWLFICQEPNSGVTKPTGPIILSGTLSA